MVSRLINLLPYAISAAMLNDPSYSRCLDSSDLATNPPTMITSTPVRFLPHPSNEDFVSGETPESSIQPQSYSFFNRPSPSVSAWTTPNKLQQTSNFSDPYEQDTSNFGDGFGNTTSAMFDFDDPQIDNSDVFRTGDQGSYFRDSTFPNMDEAESIQTTSRKKGEKSVTFHHEDIFNVYDKCDVSSTFELLFPPNSQNNHSSAQNLFSGSQMSSSSSLAQDQSSETGFKTPEIPVFKTPRSKSQPGSSGNNVSEGVTSASTLDAVTSAKLVSFSQRLKSLTSPGTPLMTPGKTTPRSGFVTPKNKTPESMITSGGKSSVSSRPGGHNRPEPGCFAAVFEGTGSASGEVGIASICLTNPALILCQFSDTKTYPRTITKLLNINPSVILVPDTMNKSVKLYEDISVKFTLVSLKKVHRKHFNESKGLQTIKHLIVPEFLMQMERQFQNKYYSLAAANALLKYIEQVENFYVARKSLKIEYQVAEKSSSIDPATAENVELLASLGPRKSKLSLFGLLNRCSSFTGIRLLRSNLYQPPIDKDIINDRLELVEELTQDISLFNNLRNIIAKFPELDSVLNLCVKRPEMNITQMEVKLDRMIFLKQILEVLPTLLEILSKSNSNICKEATKMLRSHVQTSTVLLEMMHLVLLENFSFGKGAGASKFTRFMAVRPEVNSLLDLARTTFCEYVELLESDVRQLAETHELPMKLQWNNNKGFCIQITNSKNVQIDVKKLPIEFQRIVKTKTGITFITQEFAVKDSIAKNSLEEVSKLSNAILNELLNEVREYIGFLYKLSETVATLDMLVAFANVSMQEDYIKPEFGDSLVIRGGRHPILEQIDVDLTPNDTNVDSFSRLHILTGPNMSGKSTYLRQVVLLTIMAQIGCFVPAQFATFRITDRIFSRVSTKDCIETNSSTFMVEMQETAFILSNLGPSSLVIIDELGRGTSVEEGTAICWAVCESLLKSSSFVFLATHFMQMTCLAEVHPCVENYHFLTQVESNHVVYTHQLVKGRLAVQGSKNDNIDDDDTGGDINSESEEGVVVNYGIDLASRSAFPANFVEKAKQISKRISKTEVNIVKVNQLDNLCIQYVVKLKKLANLELSDEEVRDELERIKNNFIEESKNLPEVMEAEERASNNCDEHIEENATASVDPPVLPEIKSIFHDSELDADNDKTSDGCKSVCRDPELDKEMEF